MPKMKIMNKYYSLGLSGNLRKKRREENRTKGTIKRVVETKAMDVRTGECVSTGDSKFDKTKV